MLCGGQIIYLINMVMRELFASSEHYASVKDLYLSRKLEDNLIGEEKIKEVDKG